MGKRIDYWCNLFWQVRRNPHEEVLQVNADTLMLEPYTVLIQP